MNLLNNKNTVSGYNNPLIARKIASNKVNTTNKRKSMAFQEDEYYRIVALAKSRGMGIKELVVDLIDVEIGLLEENERLRYESFLNKK